MQITIYGASDDLIEIEGDIREELYAKADATNYIAASDGTLLSIEYTDGGFWRIHRVKDGSSAFDKQEATDPDGDYSDKVTLTGENLTWVVVGELAQKRK